jgi:hypothetical protein
MRRILFVALLAAAFSPNELRAQGVECVAPRNSNVAKMLAWFDGPLAFASLGPVQHLPAGAVILGGDLTWVPTPPSSITRTDYCYTPKSEHTGLSQLFPRPRIIVGLGGGLSLEAMYLPPVTVADATPNMGSVALAWARPIGAAARHLDITLRAHATFGQVQGPITCPKDAIQQSNPFGVCWGNAPSKDTYRPNVMGGEVGIASSSSAFRWYGGLGFASLMPRFQVGFTSRNGFVDNTKVRVDLTRVSLFGGLAYAMAKSVDLSAQLYSVPQDATTARAGISWRLR